MSEFIVGIINNHGQIFSVDVSALITLFLRTFVIHHLRLREA